MPRATVDRVIALVTPWSGVQVREFNDDSVSTARTGALDKVHLSVRLTALIADGASVTSDRNDFGISVPRYVLRHVLSGHLSGQTARDIEDLTRDIEDLIDQMLGRNPKLHRPPRLAWGGLIGALAGAGIVVTEQELIDAPLTIELSPEAEVQIAGTAR